MNYTHDQARRLADLEAAFVSEMLGLESLKLVATKAEHIADLEPVVQSWLSDWGSYHARNGHSPLIKSALAVALDRLSIGRIAAAVWTFHHASNPQIQSFTEKLKIPFDEPDRSSIPASPPQPASPEPVERATERHSLQIPQRGPRGVKQILTIDSQPLEAPAAVADFLRELAHDGTARARPETARKLAELIPWAKVSRDPSAKVINHKRLYAASPELRQALQ